MIPIEQNRLIIPADYFRDEEREGFLIPEKMKRAWAAKIQLLSWMGDVFSRHDLKWWVDWGSLIGIVRHRGLIPWDDDIDISMPRADFNRAVTLLRDELPGFCEVNQYDAVNITTCVYVMNRRKTDLGDDPEEQRITELFFGCPYRCAIDIFPLDFIPDSEEDLASWKYLGESVYSVVCEYENHERAGSLEGQISLIEEITGQRLPRGDGCKKALLLLFDQISQMYTRGESSAVAVFAVWMQNQVKRSLTWYEHTVWLPFEMITAPVPAGYQQILSRSFGNWTVPVRGTTTHGYPFYQEDEKLIEDHLVNGIIRHANAMKDAGASEKEREILLAGIETHPGRYELYYLLAMSLLSVDAVQALKYLEKSSLLCPADSANHDGLKTACASVRAEIRRQQMP